MVKFLALACLSVRPPTCSRLALAIRDFLHNIYRSANASDNGGLFECRAAKYGKPGETVLCILVFRHRSSWIGMNWFVFPVQQESMCLCLHQVCHYQTLLFSFGCLYFIPPVSPVSVPCCTQIHLLVLNVIYKWVHPCWTTLFIPVCLACGHVWVYALCCVHMHVCLCECMCVIMFVYVLAVFLCVSVCPGPCLSDSAVCLTVSVSAPPPLLVVSCSLANPHSLSLSLFLSPFHSPSSSPALSPSSSLCNNSADLVSACSVLPVEFYSGLPSWLLCCLKTQAEKHDWGFFFPSHHYGLILSPFFSFFCGPKQMDPFRISNNSKLPLTCESIWRNCRRTASATMAVELEWKWV